MLYIGALAIGDDDGQTFLAAREGAEIWRRLIETDEFHQASHQPGRLAQRQFEQHLQRYRGLSGCADKAGRLAPLAIRFSQPNSRGRIKLDVQRPALLQGLRCRITSLLCGRSEVWTLLMQADQHRGAT